MKSFIHSTKQYSSLKDQRQLKKYERTKKNMKCIINASEFKIKYNYPIALYTLLELQANTNVIKKYNYNFHTT